MYTDTYLMHHGIKGMHWGVRRYQNPDGTLTAAGLRRERKEQARAEKQARKAVREQRKWNRKNASLLSDAELNAQINRLQKERQLNQLSAETINPGRKKAADTLERYGTMALGIAVSSAATAVATKYISNTINPRKSTLENMREVAEAQRTLAGEGYYQKHYDANGNVRK